ncbi:hypothetical protein VB638_01925 [Dolichospermum sp. UHCC 0684]|uniref:Uncharacterized protein n=1 Tax=Dolichospermum compactum NIES-806 TaxID=1973481 RepID=A0A1Z4V316_9CYAN|nr:MULTISPECIES: hypothetical protein [Nostocales]MDM3846271.1 hypothetical protein [Aphanizomenon gracile PMC638.10]MDM3851010.1 hypothetical protein [Aphanizomenon gracile PMC627.10]MDM3855799.1 hypothetical protein [Aphanizomenon gracile PMC649.10]MDM3860727.1 hypothetical protein [Aphanizomenon gracile PMC644.10]AFW92970.1 hypothetical protein ANA_C10161 [Anabaena sp. 90]
MLAINVEPGVVAFYEGENTFDEVHRGLIEEGFWLLSLNLQNHSRIKQSTRKALSDKFDQQQIPPIQFDQLPGSPIVVC